MASASSEEEKIVLTIDGEKFDVTEYAPVHPGEGHNDIYLEDFHGKDVSKEFLYYHAKKETTMKIVENVRKKGKHKKIVYLGKVEDNV